MTDQLFEQVDEKIAIHQQINDLYKKMDALDGTPEKTDVPEVTPETEPVHDHDHTAPERKTIYAVPDSNDSNILKALMGKLQRGLKPGQSVLKGADGQRYMLIVTSNSYQDREGETLTSAALKEDVDRHWTQGDDAYQVNNPLLFWHDDRLPIGEVVWGDVRGPFYVELAKEMNTPVAHRLWDAFEKSDEPMGASHRFAYFQQHRSDDGDYRRIFKQETSILPRHAAANLLTFSGVLPTMSKKRDEYLNKMLGLDNAAQLLDEGIDKLVSALSAQGVDHKALGEQPSVQDTLKAAMTPVAKTFSEVAEDLASLDERVEKAVTDLTSAKESFDTKSGALDEALKQVAELQQQLQAQLDARPRSASQAHETSVKEETLPEEIRQAVAAAALVDDPVFGKVKPPVK